MTKVAVCNYGAGNTRSVRAALSRLGVTSTLTADPALLYAADVVVLPGVGSARAAMAHLEATGAKDALTRRFADGKRIVGICLGLQLALEHSEEDGGTPMLGLLDGRVRHLTSERVPRLGWATVEPWGATYYFAHSYWCDAPSVVASADGIPAALAAGPFLGVQFHPEKSGEAGERWLAQCLTPA